MRIRLLLFFSFISIAFHLHSQGCSDAGVCSAGSLSLVQFKYELLTYDDYKLMPITNLDTASNTSLVISRPDSIKNTMEAYDPVLVYSDSSKKKSTPRIKYLYQYPDYSFQFSTSYGSGERDAKVITTQLEGTFKIIDQKLFAQVKVPYTFISGELGTVSGLSDITFSLSYNAYIKGNNSFGLVGGVKIPVNNANLSKDSLPLPMVYQTGLGTTDILLGAKWVYKKWDITIGYQHAFNSNKNEYVHNLQANDSIIYNIYPESRHLKRADDAVFRINRTFLLRKVNAAAGLLFIYHVANDTYLDAIGNRLEAKGSQGLTLNLNLTGVVPVSKKIDLLFIGATPLVVRKLRPDGLTRHAVILLGIKYNIY